MSNLFVGMITVVNESEPSAHRREVELLGLIGQALFQQELQVTVRLPAALAAGAVAAWERDDTQGGESDVETEVQRAVRHQEGALALIGLAVKQRSARAGDDVQVDLHAWQIGTALDVAEERGLLVGVWPPRRPEPEV